MPQNIIKESVAYNEIEKQIIEYCKIIYEDFKPDLIVGIADGGLIPALILSKELGIEFIPIKVKKEKGRTKKEEIRKWISIPLHEEIEKKSILIIDDYSYTGYTMKMALTGLSSMNVSFIKSFILYPLDNMNLKSKFKADYYLNDKLTVPPIFPWTK